MEFSLNVSGRVLMQHFSFDVDKLLSRQQVGDGTSGVPDIFVVLGSGERPSKFKYQVKKLSLSRSTRSCLW